MGEAIFGGWISSDALALAPIEAQSITVVEPTESRRDYLQDRYGVTCVADASSVVAADIVVLAVKPQIIVDVVKGLSTLPVFEEALFISIAAGVATETLNEVLPARSRLVRVMPNLPLLVGAGASVVCGSTTSTSADVEQVCTLFDCLGQAHIIAEDRIDLACALSGSGPAYVCALIEALTQAAVKEGFSPELAESLTLQMVYGTALQLKETGASPTELREAVSSPGGTTLAALAAMEKAGMNTVYTQGVAAAVRRAKELATCKV